jgi:hypothetical protein
MRGSSTLRAFSLGVLLSSAILWSVYNFEEKKTNSPNMEAPVTEKSVHEYLEQKGYIAVSKKEYKQLTKKKEIPSPKAAVPSKPKTDLVKIQQGMGSLEVARMLEKESIIKNTSDFQQYLERVHLSNKLRVGTYKIEENMSFEEIAKVLTKQVTTE